MNRTFATSVPVLVDKKKRLYFMKTGTDNARKLLESKVNFVGAGILSFLRTRGDVVWARREQHSKCRRCCFQQDYQRTCWAPTNRSIRGAEDHCGTSAQPRADNKDYMRNQQREESWYVRFMELNTSLRVRQFVGEQASVMLSDAFHCFNAKGPFFRNPEVRLTKT